MGERSSYGQEEEEHETPRRSIRIVDDRGGGLSRGERVSAGDMTPESINNRAYSGLT